MNAAIVIPICCVCNRVREQVQAIGKSEHWGTLGVYLSSHHIASGEYHLTNTYCPACAAHFTKPFITTIIFPYKSQKTPHFYENTVSCVTFWMFFQAYRNVISICSSEPVQP